MTGLMIVGGKGGVGKTTVSCALAIRSADEGKSTYLVSTDPAPSIADALGVEQTSSPQAAAHNLTFHQIDATRAFAEFRETYRERIDSLFESIAGRGVDVTHDREIIKDLFSLAPPGIDELYALTVLGEELEKGRFERIIIDPAPTGHLLRLLDMPALAVAWSHQLMRLMLKYRDVVSLGDAAQDLLDFARRTRAFDERLHDPALAGAVVVALDEPLVREETGRLTGELRDRGLPIQAIVWNRANGKTRPLPTDAAIPQLFAPPASPPPIGIEGIRKWSEQWGSLS